MIEYSLKRIARSKIATFGVMIDNNGIPFCLSLENSWKDNKPNVSCIPFGRYICKRVKSPKYGNTFEITNVNSRSHILFHWGNWAKNTLGCVLLGEEFAVLKNEPAIASSKNAFNEFLNKLRGIDSFILNIYEV